MDMVKESWKQPVKGSPFFVWEEKLRRMKVVLKSWAKHLPNPATKRKKIQSALELHHLHLEDAKITGGRILEAKIVKPMAQSRGHELILFPQTSPSKEMVKCHLRN
jgi:hypothetical protein